MLGWSKISIRAEKESGVFLLGKGCRKLEHIEDTFTCRVVFDQCCFYTVGFVGDDGDSSKNEDKPGILTCGSVSAFFFLV